MSDPRYGTHPSSEIPFFAPCSGVGVRLVAGESSDASAAGLLGPFTTVQDIALLDFEIESGNRVGHVIPERHDNALLYCYEGGGKVGGEIIVKGQVARLDAERSKERELSVEAGERGLKFLLFSGKRLNQPVAWKGPFVMTTQQEIQTAMREYGNGTFLKKRAPWDFRKKAAHDQWLQKNHGGDGKKKSDL